MNGMTIQFRYLKNAFTHFHIEDSGEKKLHVGNSTVLLLKDRLKISEMMVQDFY